MICEICHQEIGPEAFEKGEALRAKGQPVCAPCAKRLGIQPDPAGLPRPRSATEVLPPPPAAARAPGGALGPFALVLALGASAGTGWMLWQGRQWRQDLDGLAGRVQAPSGPSAGDVRSEMLAQLQGLEARLKEADQALAALRDQQGSGIRQLQVLSESMKEEARKAREDSAEARSASERALQDLAREIQEVEKALAARVEPPAAGVEAPPEAGLSAQYWDNAQARAQALSREGRYLAAAREYDRIPKRQRKGDMERRMLDAQGALERQATARLEEALKSADQAVSDGKYEYADGLLSQLEEDCGFPSLLPRIRPRLDEVRELRRRLARKEAEGASRERTKLLRSLVEDLGQNDPEARRRAVDALKAVGPDAVQPMIQALGHGDPRVRWGAVMVLGSLGSPDAVVPMAERLQDKDVQVRLAAADLLGELNDPRAVPALIDALADPDEGVGRQAANTLERITRHVPPTVAKPADAAPAWRAWWESGRRKATEP